jgi:hypothetical protein
VLDCLTHEGFGAVQLHRLVPALRLLAGRLVLQRRTPAAGRGNRDYSAFADAQRAAGRQLGKQRDLHHGGDLIFADPAIRQCSVQRGHLVWP